MSATCVGAGQSAAGEVTDPAKDRLELRSPEQNPRITPILPAHCPHGSEFRDGCPADSAEQPAFSTLLNRYKVRPPWNVAGVDYAVGIPSGVILKDPRSAPLRLHTTKTVGLPHARGHGELYGGVA
jgi:hypothetical protein